MWDMSNIPFVGKFYKDLSKNKNKRRILNETFFNKIHH